MSSTNNMMPVLAVLNAGHWEIPEWVQIALVDGEISLRPAVEKEEL